MLLGTNSMLMNQWYKFNKVSVNRNTHKTKVMHLFVIENVVIRGLQEPHLVFPLGGMLIQCSW